MISKWWIVAGFILGCCLSTLATSVLLGSYFRVNEARSLRDKLVENQALLASCKVNACRPERQQLLVAENDVALKKLSQLESEQKMGAVERSFWTLVAATLVTNQVSQAEPSASEIRQRYKAMGCGIGGTLFSTTDK